MAEPRASRAPRHTLSRERVITGALDLADRDGARRPHDSRARDALARHRWAVSLLETRATPGPANLANHEAVLAVLDAFVYGFALQEAMLADVGLDEAPAELAEQMPLTAYPHIGELAALYVTQPDHRLGDTFEIGLELVLDGIARLRG